jgi:hypothetical protein
MNPVVFNENYSKEIEVYPNPVSNLNDLSFKFDSKVGSDARIIISGVKGNFIYECEVSPDELINFKFPAHINLTPGIYIIKLIQDNKSYHKKFTVL